MDGRKPRADAKLRNLPPDQRTTLTDWLVDDGLSYAEAKTRLAKELGIKTSIGAIADFWAKECWELRFRKARTVADQIKAVVAEQDPGLDEAALAALSQRVFDMSIAKDGSPKDILLLASVIGDARKLQIEQAKVDLAREKNAQAGERIALETRKVELMQVKAAKEVLARASELTAIASDAGLSSQEKVDAARRILFGDAHVDGEKEAA
ncbi:MAG: hypothetical protein WC378_11830 [Opitutaceae bacterium]|jgi:DNA-binding phage protein